MALRGDLSVTVGEVVRFAFAVTNEGAEPVELQFRNGQPADVAVEQDGAVVWRWSDGRMFSQALWSEQLAPGESVEHELTWDDPATGRYEAVATLEAANADLEARTSFEV